MAQGLDTMGGVQAVTAFDKNAREQVRRALRRYMIEHGIGTPALQTRIVNADAPRHREIPLSTLQRFLAGSHYTIEHHVALCHQFVKDLPYYGDDHELRQFGAALCGFLRRPAEQDEGPQSLPEDLRTALEGRYQTVMEREEAAELPALDIEVTAVSERPFMHVTETEKPSSGAAPRHKFEGVLTSQGPLIFIALRSVLTHLPKIYWLERLETIEGHHGTYLIGQMSETLFREDAPDGSCVVNSKILIETRR